MSDKKIPIYSAADLQGYRNQLVGREKGDDKKAKQRGLQIEFLKAAEDQEPKKFLEQFSSCAQDTTVEVSFRSEKFTEKELLDPPPQIEQDIYQTLSRLSPRLAALPSFWNSYHLAMIQQKLIRPADLARSPRAPKTGRENLQEALQERTEELLGNCTRSILRHMGGLPEKRGNTSVFVDCSIARVWWRGHLSSQVAEDMSLKIDDVWETLRLNQVWEQLMGYSVKRLTAVSDRMIRSALIARLMQEPEKRRKKREINQGLIEKIGVRCVYQSLGALTPKQNFEIFRSMTV